MAEQLSGLDPFLRSFYSRMPLWWEGVPSHFAIKWPQHLLDLNLSISELEINIILLAFRKWEAHLSGTTVQVRSENEATVITIKTGSTRNLFIADCIRELWFICATEDIDLLISHIPGKDNNIADMLSHRFSSESHAQAFHNLQTSSTLSHTPIESWQMTPPLG